MCKEGLGLSYAGAVNRTVSGKQCQIWDQKVHDWHLNPEEIPEKDYGQAENYCRNPYGDLCGPICFITQTSEPECCQIESCGKYFFI